MAGSYKELRMLCVVMVTHSDDVWRWGRGLGDVPSFQTGTGNAAQEMGDVGRLGWKQNELLKPPPREGKKALVGPE